MAIAIKAPAGTMGIVSACLFLSAVFLALTYGGGKPTDPFTHDAGGRGSFDPFVSQFLHLSQMVAGIASGSIALIVGSSIIRRGGSLPWFYASPLMLLALSIVTAITFCAMIVYHYERATSDSSYYRRWHYALDAALGFTSLFCLTFGYIVLTWEMTRPR